MNEYLLLFHTTQNETLNLNVCVKTINSTSCCKALKRWGHQTHKEHPADPFQQNRPAATVAYIHTNPGSDMTLGVSLKEEEPRWHTHTQTPTERELATAGENTWEIAASEEQNLICGALHHNNNTPQCLSNVWVWLSRGLHCIVSTFLKRL